MAPAYRSLEDGQIVTSETPREDLEELARWEKISDEEAASTIDEAPAGNASTEKWAEYARSLGVEINADAGRDAIKEAVAAHEAAKAAQ